MFSGESPPVCPYSCEWLLLLRSYLNSFVAIYLAANSACISASFGTAAIHLLVKTASNESTFPRSKFDTKSFASSEKKKPFLIFLTTFSICSQNLWMCLSLRNLAKGSLLKSLQTKGLRAVQRLMMSSPNANSSDSRVGSGDSVELDQPARTILLSAVISTFSARRLGCEIPLACAYASASTTCPVKKRAAPSDNPPFQRRYSSRSPPGSSGKSRSSPLRESASLEDNGWFA